jgi:hypothetical protein
MGTKEKGPVGHHHKREGSSDFCTKGQLKSHKYKMERTWLLTFKFRISNTGLTIVCQIPAKYLQKISFGLILR